MGQGAHWEGIPPEHFRRARLMRKEMSPPERRLWKRLRGGQLGLKFRRQHPIGPYIADFYARQAGVVVEVDGADHFESARAERHDHERNRYMGSLGLRVLRFTASDVARHPHAVLEAIAEACRERVLSDHPDKQWLSAGRLVVGTTVFCGLELCPRRISSLNKVQAHEELWDLEVAHAHSFLTNVCALHDCI